LPAAFNNPDEKSSRKPTVCYVTDRKSLGPASAAAIPVENAGIVNILDGIRAAVDAGADWVQIREKDLPAREALALTRAAVTASEAKHARARVIVNDRLDVALAAGAGGVHLGGESLPAREVVPWCRAGNAPREFLIGVSCHTLEEARAAEHAGADYIFFGPVFDTPSKRRFGQPQGLALLSEICRTIGIPTIAIGGVDENNSVECLRAGAAGVAAIRLFQEERRPGELKNFIARLHDWTSD
jgi:thiamine-phosphate pyrophosphorylase